MKLRQALIGLIVALPLTVAHAQDKKEEPQGPPSFDREIWPLLRSVCYRCHNAEKTKGDIDLEQYSNPRLIANDRKTWHTVLDVLRSGDMPPKDGRKLKDESRQRIIEFVENTLGELDCSNPDPGPGLTRRLNRTEYNHTVQYLIGLADLSPADRFPQDALGYGFDNIGEALSLSPALVDQYYTAANAALDRVIPKQPRDQTSAEKAAREKLIFARPSETDVERDIARRVIDRFATRAFRRPPTNDRLNRLVQVFEKGRRDGADYDRSLRHAFTAVMLSPHFLMRIERSEPTTEPYRVDDYDIATRLSYFIWSSPPDDALARPRRPRRIAHRRGHRARSESHAG